MKKVLLIAFQFPPARSNEVRRVQKICKYLSRAGIHVDVIASANPGEPMDDYWRLNDISNKNLSVHRIRHFNFYSKTKYGRLFSAIFRLDWQFLYTAKLAYSLWQKRKKLPEYEYIYCTIRPYSLLFIPKLLKTISNSKVLTDFRFLFYKEPYFYKKLGKINLLYRFFDKLLLRSAVKNSNYRISLTDGLGNILKEETGYSFNTVEQGFDKEEREIVLDKEDQIEFYCYGKINLVYTGSIVPTQADPNEMAEIISIILNSSNDVVFHFFGNVGGLKKKIKSSDRIKYYGYLNYKQFNFVILRADIVWMYYSNNGQNYFRVGTKTYDYMNFGKPILCFCSRNQETVRVLKNYSGKWLILDHYTKKASKIDFEKLRNMKVTRSDEFNIFTLYLPFAEPQKHF